jgi:ADP-heptose:LPS heptosyltransferase
MKILILRFSSIGDIVLTTPVIRCVKQQTKATVHFLTKESFTAVLEANPYIDKLYTFKNDIAECVEALQIEQYDYVIDLHNNLRSLRLRQKLGCASSVFPKLNIEKWLLVQLGINMLPNIHIVARYMKAAAPLEVKYDGQGLDYFLPSSSEIKPAAVEPSLLPNGYIALVIGATHSTKRLPHQQLVRICRQIQLPVVLLGGKTEQADGAALAQASGPLIYNACGMLSLHGSACIVRDARVVITHDTGLMHIAAAFRKKIISIWGNTVPEFGMYPFYPDGMNLNTTLEVKGLRCRPCSKIGHDQCPKGHFRCMEEQELDGILAGEA